MYVMYIIFLFLKKNNAVHIILHLDFFPPLNTVSKYLFSIHICTHVPVATYGTIPMWGCPTIFVPPLLVGI